MNSTLRTGLLGDMTWDNANKVETVETAAELPPVFTIRVLQELEGYATKYITLHSRIKAAVNAGLVRQIGKFRTEVKRGSYQAVYARKDVKITPPVLQRSLGVRGEFKSII
jgi:hypothetical protein